MNIFRADAIGRLKLVTDIQTLVKAAQAYAHVLSINPGITAAVDVNQLAKAIDRLKEFPALDIEKDADTSELNTLIEQLYPYLESRHFVISIEMVTLKVSPYVFGLLRQLVPDVGDEQQAAYAIEAIINIPIGIDDTLTRGEWRSVNDRERVVRKGSIFGDS